MSCGLNRHSSFAEGGRLLYSLGVLLLELLTGKSPTHASMQDGVGGALDLPYVVGAVGGARGVDDRGDWRGAGAARRRAEEKMDSLPLAPAKLRHSTPLASSNWRSAHIPASHGQMLGRPPSHRYTTASFSYLNFQFSFMIWMDARTQQRCQL